MSAPAASGITRRRAWLLATRPKTLPAGLSPVIVGAAAAAGDGVFSALPALAALAGALLLQVGVNLANDYFDFKGGIDQSDRKGPLRVTQSGLIPPEQVRLAMTLTLAAAALVGLYLVARGGTPILVIGIASRFSPRLRTAAAPGRWPRTASPISLYSSSSAPWPSAGPTSCRRGSWRGRLEQDRWRI